jgi:hypothetical protein
MDLQQILNYRTNCLICQTPMSYADSGKPNINFWDDEKGFHIRRHTAIRVDLNFDGTYFGSNKSLKRCDDLVFTKVCRACEDASDITPPVHFIMKSRSIGATTIDELINKQIRCRYSFRTVFQQNTYSMELVGESIAYNEGNKFSCIDTFFNRNNSVMMSGNYSSTIRDIINSRVNIPTAINLSKIKNLQEYLNKYNLLLTFS